MKIKRLVIENFKSIERIELVEPRPFTVFVGPNGSGKSNIFEALEFVNVNARAKTLAESLFGGRGSFINRNSSSDRVNVTTEFDTSLVFLSWDDKMGGYNVKVRYDDSKLTDYFTNSQPSHHQFIINFLHLFIGNEKRQKLNFKDNNQLTFSGNNLENVLKRILTNQQLRSEIFEWLELFVPEFKAVEVDDRDELHWFEQSSPNYFTKDMISDGTYNILALLTAVYQSDDKPQFLCIEEPENGLHPQVAGELVDFFRIMCEERGHYIWLNTHSQSMAMRVKPEEFVIVEKKQGATTTRQFSEGDFSGMRTDEAWLTNALNGGLAW
ncbi:AAA family ATPase [Spirosoma utsteinense]|uniref:ATPase n=1 Tax=Spirosoma utsteinense TaxID=2585773 RepID=A0ABR6W4I2_9BACT|nr:AAA family ATPase [Spirosoma utsteinense]MBC3785145.1 putative ATPase [Spirosoma utsteinense]MBC3790630.1 putative ATPase [Spirosoma utsteinense]